MMVVLSVNDVDSEFKGTVGLLTYSTSHESRTLAGCFQFVELLRYLLAVLAAKHDSAVLLFLVVGDLLTLLAHRCYFLRFN